MYLCTYVCAYVYKYVHMYVRTSAHCVYVFMHVCVCVYVCMYVYMSVTIDNHGSGGFPTRTPSKRAAVERCISPRGDWDRSHCQYTIEIPDTA